MGFRFILLLFRFYVELFCCCEYVLVVEPMYCLPEHVCVVSVIPPYTFISTVVCVYISGDFSV